MRESNEYEKETYLIKKFVENRDEKAFIRLIKIYTPGVRRFLYVLLNGQREDIEDVEQELIMALYRSLPSFNFKSSFKTYIYRMARNKAVNLIRKRKIEEKLVRLLSFKLFKKKDDPEEQVILKGENANLIRQLFSLDKEDRMLIILKDIEGISINEISEILSLPKGTVKSKLHRSRKKLLKLLEGGGGE